MKKAPTIPPSTIGTLVEQNNGPVEVARLLGDAVAYQEVQRWVRRGWANPKYALRLEPLLLKKSKLKLRDLLADLEANNASLAESAKR